MRVPKLSCSFFQKILSQARGQNGPDIAHLGILPQFGVIEILSCSCSVLFLEMADGDHLALQIAKNQNGVMQRLL